MAVQSRFFLNCYCTKLVQKGWQGCSWIGLTGLTELIQEQERKSRVRFTYTLNLRASRFFLLPAWFTRDLRVMYVCHTRGKSRSKYKIRDLGIPWWCCALPNSLPFFLLTSSLPFCLCAICPSFCHILHDGRGLCPELSATLFRHGYRSKESTTKSGCADELHP